MRELIINIICNNAILRSVPIGISLLVADENVVGFFFLSEGKDFLLNSVNLLCLLLIKRTLVYVSIFNGCLVVVVGNDRFIRSSVAGRYLLKGSGVVYVFNAVLTEYKSPICLRLSGIRL